MNAKGIAAVLGVVVLVAVGGAAAFVAGVGPLGDIGGGSSDVTSTPASTGTVYGGADDSGPADSSGGDGGTGTETSDGDTAESLPPYTFSVESIEECGQTCRDVTVRLVNNRNETATGVRVYTRMFAGNSTDRSDKVWEGTKDVGTLGPGASTTETSRVKLSYSAAYQVQQNDGWITIVTTVESDDVTITFKERRDVA